MRRGLLGIGLAVMWLLVSAPAASAERLCDPAGEDCRAILLNLIRAESTGIDVAFWFIEDGRYTAELVRRAQAGVPVRVLVDPRANAGHPVNAQLLQQLSAAGIPMRQRTASGILHWKMMLFAGQGQVEFSGANYSPDALVYTDPYRNYVDEAIMFSDDAAIVHSFMQRFDDLWTDTRSYADYANISVAPGRRYPGYPIAPELNFPPSVSYRARAVSAYNAEQSAIDAIMYRITDRAHTDAIIAAVQRGVRVRLITEQEEYRDATRPWHSWNIDRLYMAGVEIRHRAHAGLNHQKSIVLRSQGMAIFGSSNWTSPSSQSQEEHNDFSTKPSIFNWFTDQFERKWNNTGPAPETQPFVPLAPGIPVYTSPAPGSAGVSLTASLTFSAGPFAHLYDIYFGTSANPPLLASDVPLGPTETASSPRVYELPPLAPATTYYWRVVAKTMALQTSAGPVWSFTTGTGPVTPPRPFMSIDIPAANAVVRQPFAVAGWALDAAATRDNGVDAVHAYAFPFAGGPPLFLGAAAVTGERADIGAAFGPQFGSAGYDFVVRGLAPGSYRLAVFVHSTVSGSFVLDRTVDVRVEPSTLIAIDTPSPDQVVGQGFLTGGWAVDFGAASAGGIDVVHVYAYPLDWAGSAVFLGQAAAGVSRPDLAAAFGGQFGLSGFSLHAPVLQPGRYLVAAYAHSVLSGAFTAAASVTVRVR
jgi:hypothetical protein